MFDLDFRHLGKALTRMLICCLEVPGMIRLNGFLTRRHSTAGPADLALRPMRSGFCFMTRIGKVCVFNYRLNTSDFWSLGFKILFFTGIPVWIRCWRMKRIA